MKLSKKQQDDIECIEYFIPTNCDWANKTDKDVEMFMEWSEKGSKYLKELSVIPPYKTEGRTYFHALCWGKKRRGINIFELWEPAILSGDTYYAALLEGMPRVVVNHLKKEIFQGMDAELIEDCYLSLL